MVLDGGLWPLWFWGFGVDVGVDEGGIQETGCLEVDDVVWIEDWEED